MWWTWPIVFIGQMCVALCFAELAGQFPLAGSVYQWSKRDRQRLHVVDGRLDLIVGSIVTVAAVAVAWQVVLPQVSTKFQFIGDSADAGTYLTQDGAKNALLLGAILVVVHDDRQHARRQADGADQQRRRHRRADRRRRS